VIQREVNKENASVPRPENFGLSNTQFTRVFAPPTTAVFRDQFPFSCVYLKYCNPNYFWRISNVAEVALFMCNGGKQGGELFTVTVTFFFFLFFCFLRKDNRDEGLVGTSESKMRTRMTVQDPRRRWVKRVEWKRRCPNVTETRRIVFETKDGMNEACDTWMGKRRYLFWDFLWT